MGRLLRIFGIGIAVLVALLVVAAIMLALVFDPNDYKDKISAGVKDATGRDLVIEGDLELSLFPWLAIEVGRTELGNAPGFDDTPFASFDSAELRVRLMPMLLQREVVVGTAALDSLTVNLQVRKDGTGNWEDFGEAAEETPQEDAGADASPAALDIAGVAVTNSALTYTDLATGDSVRVTDLDFTTGRIASDESATVTITDLEIGANVEGALDVPVPVRFSAPGITVETEAQSVDVGELGLEVSSLELLADVEPFSYAGDPQPTARLGVAAFSPRTLMNELRLEPPATADPDVLETLRFDAVARVGTDSIALSDLELVIDDTTFRGTLSVPRGEAGFYELELAGDAIDIARYMAPAGEEASGETSASETVEIPVELIRPLKARGNLSIAEVHLGDILFEEVTVGVNAAGGRLRIHPISADFFDGGYRGDVRIDAAGEVPSITVDENITDVNLAAMALAMFELENITGTINGSFQLGGRGADMDAIRRDLDGKLSMELEDGAWEGVDVWYQMRRARALVKGTPVPEAPAEPRTPFSSMKATGVVTDGVMQNDDFFAELPFMQLTGRGSVDFVEASVDYTLTGRILERPEFAGEVSQEELDDFTKAVIPFRVTGPLADPDIRPDLEAMLKQRVEEEAKKLIFDKLLDDDEEPAAEGEEPAGEKDVEDQLKDEAKKRLKDLFGD